METVAAATAFEAVVVAAAPAVAAAVGEALAPVAAAVMTDLAAGAATFVAVVPSAAGAVVCAGVAIPLVLAVGGMYAWSASKATRVAFAAHGNLHQQ